MMYAAKKSLGQNFLIDNIVIHNILSFFNAKPQDNIIEIGPGLGALTSNLYLQTNNLSLIEYDKDLYVFLKKTYPTANLINKDALTVDYSSLGDKIRIIGNLPYNIATPLIFHILTYRSNISDMLFMVQKEVADRIVATPHNKAYGKLSVVMQYLCCCEKIIDVPPDAFNPKPKVDSSVVSLVPYNKNLPIPLESMQKILQYAFTMKRKTIANNLKSIIRALDLENLGIDPKNRPEDLTIEQYIRIVQFLDKSFI